MNNNLVVSSPKDEVPLPSSLDGPGMKARCGSSSWACRWRAARSFTAHISGRRLLGWNSFLYASDRNW